MKKYELFPFEFGKAFVDIKDLKDGKIIVSNRFCINNKGQKLFELPDSKMNILQFDDEDVAKVGYNGAEALINSKGEFLTLFMEEHIGCYDEEFKVYSLCGSNGYGIINSKGKIIIPPVYDYEIGYYDGVATVHKGNYAGAYDLDGNIIIPFEYKYLDSYSDGLICATKQDNSSGYIDKNNNVVIPFGKYNCCNSFNNGVAIVLNKQYEQIYIDKKGNIIKLEDISNEECV